MNLLKTNINSKNTSKPNIFYVGKKIDDVADVEGPDIHFYYIYNYLLKTCNVKVFNRKLKDNIFHLLSSDIIWIEYPFGRYPVILSLMMSFIRKKKIALIIRDLPVRQAKSLKTMNKSTLFYLQLDLIQKLIVKRANVISLFSPGFADFLNIEDKKMFIFTPGVREELLHKSNIKSTHQNKKKILLYAGSLDRGGMISNISSIFSEIEGWEFWIAGEGDEKIYLNNNTKYLGALRYQEVEKLYDMVDAVTIPYPMGNYFDICTPLKTAEVLASCKPVIASKNRCLLQYINEIGLNNNVLFIDNWNIDNLKKSLILVENISISREETYEKLSFITWNKKSEEIVSNVLNALNTNL